MTSSQTILIDTIKATDGIWQLCSEYDAMLIDVYKEALNEGVTLPPIAVFQVGDKRFLADGQHRLRAHKELGRTEINADLFHGTDCGDAYRVRGSPCPLQGQRPKNLYSKGKNMTCCRKESHDLRPCSSILKKCGHRLDVQEEAELLRPSYDRGHRLRDDDECGGQRYRVIQAPQLGNRRLPGDGRAYPFRNASWHDCSAFDRARLVSTSPVKLIAAF